jgi:hypothetical protein
MEDLFFREIWTYLFYVFYAKELSPMSGTEAKLGQHLLMAPIGVTPS